MPSQSSFEEYMFRYHSKETLQNWASKLKYFRFVRAYGGHANDGDTLLLKIQFDNDKKRLEFVKYLMGEKNPSKLTDIVECGGGHINIKNNDRIFIWFEPEHTISLHISNKQNAYEVAEEDVERGVEFERTFLKDFKDLKVIDPPQDNNYCFCNKFYK